MKHLFYETKDSNGEIYVKNVKSVKFNYSHGELHLTYWTIDGKQPVVKGVIEFSIH